MVSNSLKYGIVGVVVVVAIIAVALVAIPSMTPTTPASQSSSSQGPTGGSGTLNIYLTDAPPGSQTLKYLLVNVSSVDLAYEGSLANSTTSSVSSTSSSSTSTSSTTTATSSTSQTRTGPLNTYTYTVPASTGQNVNLTSLQGKSLLLGTTNMPAGNITQITLNISGAKAFYADGSTEQLRVVADGKLMIPIRFSVQANGSTDLTIDITPNFVHISQGGVLTPVLHATAVSKGRTTTTESAEVTASENSTTTAAP